MSRLDAPRRGLGRELADDLRRRVLAGEWASGERLPSEHEIGQEYAVSRATVRTALQSLEARGLVDIRHGLGTFVSNLASGIRVGMQDLRSMTEQIRELGHEPTMSRRSIGIRPATPAEATKLSVSPDAEVWEISRAVSADGEVVAFSHDVIPVSILPAPGPETTNASLEAVEIGHGSVFGELERAGHAPVRAVAEVHAVHAESMPWADAAGMYLMLDQLHETRRGVPVLYSQTYFAEGRFQFVLLRTRLP